MTPLRNGLIVFLLAVTGLMHLPPWVGLLQATIPTFVARGASCANVDDCVPGLPAGHQLNDILVLACESSADVTYADPTDYTQFTNSPQNQSTATQLNVWWKRHDGSEADPTVVDPAAAGDHLLCVIEAFRGVITTGDPFDVTSGNSEASVADYVMPAVTTTVANTLIVWAATAQSQATADAGFTNAALANVTTASDRDVLTALGDDGTIVMGNGDWASSGDTGTTAGSWATTVNMARLTIALKEEAAAAATVSPFNLLFGQ